MKRSDLAAALAASALCLPPAFPNGINPPRPSGGQTTDAVCKDRGSGEATTVRRARILVDQSAGTLWLRTGVEAGRRAQLASIGRIVIAPTTAEPETNTDGEAAATISLLQPAYEGPGFVRLREGTKPVRLVGFSDSGTRVDLPLARCAELVLTTLTTGPSGSEAPTPAPTPAPPRGPSAS